MKAACKKGGRKPPQTNKIKTLKSVFILFVLPSPNPQNPSHLWVIPLEKHLTLNAHLKRELGVFSNFFRSFSKCLDYVTSQS